MKTHHMPAMGVVLGALASIGSMAGSDPARAMAPDQCKEAICWEIVNRFRLFADQADFQPHVDAWRATAADGRSVLAMERWLATQKPFERHGWAASVLTRKIVSPVCFDDTKNRVLDPCPRDGASESYFNPRHFLVRLSANPPNGFESAQCEWIADRGFVDRNGNPTTAPIACSGAEARVLKGKTQVKLVLHAPGGATSTQTIVIEPKVAIVAGMGDSFTSGDGNPDVPVKLKHIGSLGMCFRRPVSNQQFWLPARQIDGSKDCNDTTTISDPQWVAARAKWLYAPCHRSLYGHQARAAIALAVENVHRAIAYIPLGCTGAEISKGVLQPQPARERMARNEQITPQNTPAQIDALTRQLNGAKPDLVFLTVGGNDVGFVQMAANIIVVAKQERRLLGSRYLFGPNEARRRLPALGRDFRALRAKLQGIVGGDLDKVVYTPYGNPLTHGAGKQLCGDTRRGYDSHPALGFDGANAAQTSHFVETELVPTLKRLVTCERAGDCLAPDKDRMRWADSHRDQFAVHGICARFAASDALKEPAFDDACFADDHTFWQWGDQGANGLAQPFRRCNQAPSNWRPYAPRGRWMRTPNDSYLSAMTYADSLPRALHGQYVNDAIWGVSGVLYGGAAHPTAEGHAAMADADLVEARKVLPPTP